MQKYYIFTLDVEIWLCSKVSSSLVWRISFLTFEYVFSGIIFLKLGKEKIIFNSSSLKSKKWVLKIFYIYRAWANLEINQVK